MFSNAAARKSVDSLSPWSPTSTSEFPFHRQSATSHPKIRRGSTASSIHSIGGQLDTSPNTWSHAVLETGQNAISTLLQPPIVRTGLQPHTVAPASSTHKPPTARDIPPVTLTNVPHVDASEFAPYLAQVGALYDQLRRMQESDDDVNDQVLRRGRSDDLSKSKDDGHLRPGSRASSTRSVSPIDPQPSRTPIRRRSSSGYSRKQTQGPPPLSTIPNVYFDEDFHLENPRIFDIVSERSEIVQPTPGSTVEKKLTNGNAQAPRKALATNAILQEKLSWYMDTVEMHLISSISTASTTFFTALGSLKELHSEAADSVEQIKTLRKELEALDLEIATSGLDIVQKQRRRENLQQLNDAVKQLKDIVDSVAACENLVEDGDLQNALDNIDGLENLIAGRGTTTPTDGSNRGPQLRNLRDAVALQGVNDSISTLRFRIGKAFEARLIELLLGDLRRHIDDLATREVLSRWSSAAMRSRGAHTRDSSAFPAYLAKTENLRSQLMPVLVGLHRSKHIAIAIASYREVVMREIRSLVKRPLPTSHDDDNESMVSASTMSSKRLTQQEKSSILARNLRALDEQDAEELFIKMYVSVTETLRRLTTQVKVLFDVASSIGESPVSNSDRSPSQLKSPPLNSANRDIQEDIHMTMDMANLLGQAVDTSQEKIVKVLRVRSEQSARLPLVWFLRYFTLNLYFANECESISGRSGTSLKTVVNAHIKDFIQSHGDAEKQKLAQAMESDQWKPKDFTEKDNVLLGQILECSTKDSQPWTEGSQIWIPFSDIQTSEDMTSNGRPRAESNGAPKEKTRSAIIDSEPFLLPNSAILCMEGMTHFLHLITGIPSMASDISASLVAYLQLFNSRCTQLILGAGATKSAGLKNITTRHLALASQALAFIATLIPHVREFVRRHAGSGPNVNNANVANLMGEFDKVKRLFQEHQNNIYDKLVEIMSGRAALHAKAMKGIQWEQESEQKVNAYMETLANDTVTLHRVLAKHLPEGTARLIMNPVFDSYKSQIGNTLQAIEAKNEVAIKRMESDVLHLIARLDQVDGFGDTGDHLLNIVKSKQSNLAATKPEAKDSDDKKDPTADEDAQQASSNNSNNSSSN
ncbi:Vps54-like protein-domain-containing protein [Xylaria bambusicola]|uniref:Vps54-like protein-domain-containing protein n=1 Tax=Xylaria bambusicola TaxID=326684 RepID=UPI002008D9F8|nr:Vps54-like protein-domain-containing protein [Xylaria bambusicola]KAI0525414.1 Vps54-like protein-domain-containing protein [Xylaria bambusicola]